MSQPWFKPKRFGYGATPTNAKGWALTIGFALFIVALAIAVKADRVSVEIGIVIGLAVAAGFIVLTKAKTEGPWRWRSWSEHRSGRR